MHFLLPALALLALPALADPVEIPGPAGPLEAARITSEGATHAVVIVPGSGPIDRDGNAPGLGLVSDSYKLLAEGLAARGIASLRIDKRGFFGSSGAISDPNDVTVAAYAEDVRAWVARASTLAPCVWIAGHSEGGLVALLAAEEPPAPLCGLILLATAGRPTGRLLIEQLAARPANAPIMAEAKAIISDLESGQTRDTATIPPVLQPLFPAGVQRYMIDLFAHDPARIARRWHGPVLILQGDADAQVRILDADLLAAAMPQARRVILPGSTHMLKIAREGAPLATYTMPDLPLHPSLIPAIADFLEHQTASE